MTAVALALPGRTDPDLESTDPLQQRDAGLQDLFRLRVHSVTAVPPADDDRIGGRNVPTVGQIALGPAARWVAGDRKADGGHHPDARLFHRHGQSPRAARLSELDMIDRYGNGDQTQL